MNAGGALRKEGNRPYYASGLFFDTHQRKDIMRLYDFVRAAKHYANHQPAMAAELQDLIAKWHKVSEAPIRELEPLKEDDPNTRVAKNMARLKILYGFEVEWIDAFLVSMLMDTKPKKYKTLEGSLAYVYGAAEAVGLMVASMLRLPKDARISAETEARALQWITFVRDIAEDAQYGRLYFPDEDLQQFGLKDLQEKTTRANPAAFHEFIQLQVGRYRQWQIEASHDLAYVPRRPRVAINTAIHGFDYIAKQITKHPFVIYEHKVAPPRARLVLAALSHSFD
jgi:15-cis-phytoene synthase